MRIDLTPRWARFLFLCILAFLAGLLASPAGKVWLAARESSSPNPQKWRLAAALEPDDAEYWTNLGLYEQRDLTRGVFRAGIGYLLRAVSADPRSAQRWLDLAAAYRDSGDAADARGAFQRAEQNSPLSAEVAWRYGSFLLAENESAAAYPEIRRALILQPSLTASAISECWQQNPDVAPILNDVLPARTADYPFALNFFLGRNLLAPALAVWNRQLDLRLSARMSDAIPLVDALIDADRMTEAETTWRQALLAANWPRNEIASRSLVFNGGFERPIAAGGFGWLELPIAGADFALDAAVRHSGSRSLRIDFDGTANLDFRSVLQRVAVQPRARYRFSAFLRTRGLTTDSGIRFEILDPRHPSALDTLTPNLVGTNSWTLVGASLATGRDTDLLEIALRRVPTWKFDNKIQGTVWVDDVSLVPVRPGPKDARK